MAAPPQQTTPRNPNADTPRRAPEHPNNIGAPALNRGIAALNKNLAERDKDVDRAPTRRS